MRNIAVPQRSHVTFSLALRLQGSGTEDGFDRMGRARRSCNSRWSGFVGSGIGRDYKLNAMDFTAARERMVASQIVARGIRDERVLEALRHVPRHLFVSASARGEAYDDRPLPIGSGQTISQPYMVAIMTATLGVEADNRVLEIGTGSGYQTAILARLAREVISIERHEVLAVAGRGDDERARYRECRCRDRGWLARVSAGTAVRPDPRDRRRAGHPRVAQGTAC